MHRILPAAALLLLISLGLSAQNSSTARNEPSPRKTTPAQLQKHLNYLAADSLLGRGFGTPEGLKSAHYIAEQMKEAGLEPIDDCYLLPFNWRKGILNIPGNNVAGMVRGSDPELQGEYIVLGAHYDHLGWYVNNSDTTIYNGADDNASGVAGIIEIGRNLVARKDQLKRSVILVAFDGEESGLVGSTLFVEEDVVPAGQIRAMFSLDMIGMVEAHGGIDMKGLGQLEDQDLILQIAEKHHLTITKKGRSVELRTDTSPFGDAGIPAVHAFTGTESPYHKPEDDSDLLDYEGMATVSNFMSDVTVLLSMTEKVSGLPPGDPEKVDVFGHGLRLNVGSALARYPDDWYRSDGVLALQAGYMMNIRLASILTLQPEILYELGGSSHPGGTLRSHALTVPLNLQLINKDEGFIRMFCQIGGFYSYHFAGSIDGAAIDLESQYAPHEYGISGGIGMNGGPIQIGVYFQRGLSNRLLAPDPSGANMHASRLYFSMGYFF